MASRLFAASAAAASSSPSPLVRRITPRVLPCPAGRRWYYEGRRWYYEEKVNLWEAPRNPMRWKHSHPSALIEPADMLRNSWIFVVATFTVWGVLVLPPIFAISRFLAGDKKKTKASGAQAKTR